MTASTRDAVEGWGQVLATISRLALAPNLSASSGSSWASAVVAQPFTSLSRHFSNS